MYGDKIDSHLLTAWTPFEMVSSLLKMKWKQHVNNHDLNDSDFWKYEITVIVWEKLNARYNISFGIFVKDDCYIGKKWVLLKWT